MSVIETAALRPRDLVQCHRLGYADIEALAILRSTHPGGAPDLVPTHWVGATVPGVEGLVAAVGWVEEKPGMRMVTEVDRVDTHWGAVGTHVLIRNFVASSFRHAVRVQALILPENTRLKNALRKAGALCIAEIWEPKGVS